jgi:hypothetical protein
MPVKSAVTIQAQWQVTAEDDVQQDTRIVWATDAGTALMIAAEARGWGSTACAANRVSDWHKVYTFALTEGRGSGYWLEPTTV